MSEVLWSLDIVPPLCHRRPSEWDADKAAVFLCPVWAKIKPPVKRLPSIFIPLACALATSALGYSPPTRVRRRLCLRAPRKHGIEVNEVDPPPYPPLPFPNEGDFIKWPPPLCGSYACVYMRTYMHQATANSHLMTGILRTTSESRFQSRHVSLLGRNLVLTEFIWL